MKILAVESSCDETSVAIVEDGKRVLSHIILSQMNIHALYGGVVPEIASRNHIVHMTRVFEQALDQAKLKTEDIDLVAVTKGPGLIGSLLVGINAATAFAYSIEKPLMGVNHLLGHIYAANIENDIEFPALALLVSGGHTELLYMEDHMQMKQLGTTRDDAVGEAYDKVARVLGLPYPGGPSIDKLSILGKETYTLPRAMINHDTLDFSFSGLKSAVMNSVNQANQKGEIIRVEDMCASFQASVIEVLIDKTSKAKALYQPRSIILAGGVAANKALRKKIVDTFTDVKVLIPKFEYCTDNAAMIGAAAYYQYRFKQESYNYHLKADPHLDFDVK